MFSSVDSYYKFHSKIYDLSRWSILFGKSSILNLLPNQFEPKRILDVGCGTGYHLKNLQRNFPNAEIIGIDTSTEMLAKAEEKIVSIENITLINSDCNQYLETSSPFDIVICSYSLTMFKDIPKTVSLIHKTLRKDGFILVVDFKNTPSKLFRKWMLFNHVDISGILFSELTNQFKSENIETKSAYFGLWKFAKYLGRK